MRDPGRHADPHFYRVDGNDLRWTFERQLVADQAAPNHQVLHSAPPFTAKDLPFELLGTMRMTLTTARWSLSPLRGRENWPAVTARVFNLRQCCTTVDTPSPPPSPPSPPSPPPPCAGTDSPFYPCPTVEPSPAAPPPAPPGQQRSSDDGAGLPAAAARSLPAPRSRTNLPSGSSKGRIKVMSRNASALLNATELSSIVAEQLMMARRSTGQHRARRRVGAARGARQPP
jgi:hypothetical protein